MKYWLFAGVSLFTQLPDREDLVGKEVVIIIEVFYFPSRNTLYFYRDVIFLIITQNKNEALLYIDSWRGLHQKPI